MHLVFISLGPCLGCVKLQAWQHELVLKRFAESRVWPLQVTSADLLFMQRTSTLQQVQVLERMSLARQG